MKMKTWPTGTYGTQQMRKVYTHVCIYLQERKISNQW
jgi:hypothetical protein